MKGDSKRVNGPDESQSPCLFLEKEEEKRPLVVNEERADGRRPDQMRLLFMQIGIVSQAKGSAYVELNNTKVICAVYGPREVPRRDGFAINGLLRCEFKFATFASRVRRGHIADNMEKEMGLQVQQALEPAVCLHKIPKSQVDVFVTVIEDDGSALAAAITCASIAVADAGIEMYDIVIGCSVRQAGELVLMDPTSKEEYHGEDSGEPDQASVTVGLLPSLNQISALIQRGQLRRETSIKAIQQCVEGSQSDYSTIYGRMVKSVRKKLGPTASLEMTPAYGNEDLLHFDR